ncbi:MAG: hypothetical protein IJM78_03190 [Prevotella sp.]|nr:hypothetical protein [Prevotella sp.]
MKSKTIKLLTAVIVFLFGSGVCAAGTVTIPTTAGTYIDWNDAALSNASVENSGANIGSTSASTVATFTISNSTQQDYVMTFKTGSKYEAKMQVTVTNTSTSDVVLTKSVDVVNTGNWSLSTKRYFLISQLPAGTYELKFQVTEASSYAGNWGDLAIYTLDDCDKDCIPGTLTLANGTHNGCQTENSNTNVGYIKDGVWASYPFISAKDGVYKMTLDIARYNGGTMNIVVTDDDTNTEEVNMNYAIESGNQAYTSTDITLEGFITKGENKTIKYTFTSNQSSWICNYKAPTFTWLSETFAKINDVAITGQTVSEGASSDWYCQLPVTYDATTTFSVSPQYGTVAATAVDGNNQAVAVIDNGDGTFTIATPERGTTTAVTLVLTPSAGAYSTQTTYTFNIFRIGEMSLTDVTIDGTSVDVLGDINSSSTTYTATYGGCYTTAPTVAAVQIDGANATVGTPTVSGSTYTYTIHAAIENTDIERDYTLVLNNVHVYTPTGSEQSVNIKNNEGTRENNTWTNGIYTLSTTSLDGYNEYFKMNGNSYTLSLPADVVVKQLIMKDCSNNYSGNNARLTAVTSTGATAYIPVDNKYYHESEGAKHDIIVNIDGHTPGADIVLTQQKSGQPMAWIQLVVVKQNPGTAPQKTAEVVNVVNNHAVVTLTFDREIPGDVVATINNTTVTAEGGSAVLVFPIWNLAYSTNYTMTIAANAVTDNYGNKNAAAIEVAVNTSAKPAVSKAAYDYVVSNASELDAALEALKTSNRTASATRKTVFLKNGNYTYGTLEGSYQYNVSLKIDNWNNVYNVSLIGESKEGVVIEGTTDGITSSTLNLGNGTGIYVQDMTIRNNYDYPNANKGVSVAVTGGNKAVLKNVAMQACQDTYVTGQRTYLENCDIYGTVDFICGGGNIFFNQCDLILLNRAHNVIVAPNTTADTKWGYVFQGCTIKAVEGATAVVDKDWDLGRPWQNEPRTYFLNTKMEVLPSDNGWKSMGTLPTHFYEYNSMDKNGNALDLSVRGNSPTSTNHYTPVLTAAEAAKFTVENVLGGTDSWLPTEETAVVAAPANFTATYDAGTYTLTWTAVDDARCYVIFKDGEYLADVTTTSYETTEAGVYTLRSANLYGGLGSTSTVIVTVNNPAAKITTSSVGWSTGCFDAAVKIPEGTKAYYVSDVTTADAKATMTLTALTEVPAAEGFIFNAIAGTYFLEAADSPAAIDNKLGGTLVTTAVSDLCGDGIYTLAVVDAKGNVGFKPYTPSTLGANKAYLPKTLSQGAKIIGFVYGDATTTGISSMDNGQLIIDNGQWTMSNDDSMYNLAGQRVGKHYKGIAIINGRKVVMK